MKEQKQDAIKQLKELLNPIEQKYIPDILDDIFDSKITEHRLKAIHTTMNFIKREEIINIKLDFKDNSVQHIFGKLKHVESHTEVEEYKRRFSTSLRYSTQHKKKKVILHDFTFKIAI